MMEEYANTQAAEGFLADEIKPMKLPKMGVVDLWKMWKLRHRRTTIQQVCPQSEGRINYNCKCADKIL